MRKWKAKLKDWGFEKYSKAEDMAFITSKMQSRKAEGKDTEFKIGGRQITKEAMENFMNRKRADGENIGSPTASKIYTPQAKLYLGEQQTPQRTSITVLQSQRSQSLRRSSKTWERLSEKS